MLLLLLSRDSLFGQVSIEVLAIRQPQQAFSRLMSTSRSNREAGIARLLTMDNQQCSNVAVDVINKTLAWRFLPHLRQLRTRTKGQRFRQKLANSIETLTLYQTIAVEEPDLLSVAPRTGDASRKTSVGFHRRPVTVAVQVQDIRRKPVSGAKIQAYSDDYGVGVPHRTFLRSNAAGRVQLSLFPGQWTFFASAGTAGNGLYICRSGVDLTEDTQLVLRPTRTVTLTFRRSRKAFDLDEFKLLDYEYAGFLPLASVGASANGKLRLAISKERPLYGLGIRQPRSGAAVVLHAKIDASKPILPISADDDQMGMLDLRASTNQQRIANFELQVAVPQISDQPIKLKGTLPMKLYVSPGQTLVSYDYLTSSGHHLTFRRKSLQLASAKSELFKLGGPYETSIFHQYKKQFAGKNDVLMYQLFVKDANGLILRECRRATAGRNRGALETIPIVVRNGQSTVIDTRESAPDNQFWSEAGTIGSSSALDSLEYHVQLPFAKQLPRAMHGHGQNFTKASKRYQFVAPEELAPHADAVLEGCENIYSSFAKVLGHPATWQRRKPRSEVRFIIKMPPGAGAYAAGGNVHFTTRAGMELLHPRHVMNIALRHEILHTFGYGHSDYMAIVGQVAAVEMNQGRSAARIQKNAAFGESLLKALRGQPVAKPSAVVPHFLLNTVGFDLFRDYLSKGRPWRNRLNAMGLNQVETDSAIFDFVSSGKTDGVYKSFGVAVNEDFIERGVASLTAASSDSAQAERGDASDIVSRSRRQLARAFDVQDEAAVIVHLNTLKEQLPLVTSHRSRCRQCIRVGELLMQNNMRQEAIENLKNCQHAALLVGLDYYRVMQRLSLKVLRGEPLGLIP